MLEPVRLLAVLSPLIAACTVAAQAPQPAQEPDAKAVAAAAPGITERARRNLLSMLQDPDLVLFDRPEADGAWWSRGSNFKASFDAGGWTFFCKPPSEATEIPQIGFRLAQVMVANQLLPIEQRAPVRADRRITYDHGSLLETIDVDGGGVEQQFVFDHLPARGELQIDVAIATRFAAQTGTDGIVFYDGAGCVHYSRAIAIDAAGKRTFAATEVAGDRIRIRVPASFMAAAVLPLTIDPRVAYNVSTANPGDLAEPDVCSSHVPHYPGIVLVWSVVFANHWGANDWDCYVQQFDENLQPFGGLAVIDYTTAGWARPRIANVMSGLRTLVVAQVHNGASLRRISGRAISYSAWPGWTVGSSFDIATDTVDCLRPDIGGNPSLYFIQNMFTVVWERATTATNHDIYARRVDWANVLSPVITIQADASNQSNPSISKSCGYSIPQPTARFGIVYQNRAWAGNEDIHGAMLTFDGLPVLVNGAATFPVDTSSHNDILPQVSSPTIPDGQGGRLFLAAYERTTSGSGDIAATCFDHTGAVRAQANISALENDPTREAWRQSRPAVDSDGLRFGIAYHELYQNNTQVNDLDTRMSLTALAGSNLVVSEPGAILGYTGNREFNVQVASKYSATGSHSPHYCTTNDRDNTNNSFAIDTRTFEGVPVDTFTTRATGCGSAFMVWSGNTRAGSAITFTLNLSPFLGGFVIGTAANSPIAACPGCTLGVSGSTTFASQTTLTIPAAAWLIGLSLAVQGFLIAPSGAPCLGQIYFTDTVDFTVQ